MQGTARSLLTLLVLYHTSLQNSASAPVGSINQSNLLLVEKDTFHGVHTTVGQLLVCDTY